LIASIFRSWNSSIAYCSCRPPQAYHSSGDEAGAWHLRGTLSGIADPFNGHIDAFRTAHVQRSDGWIATTWNNLSDPGAFAVAAVEEEDGGEPPPLAGAGVVVCMMG
jgi:hypothetical protein